MIVAAWGTLGDRCCVFGRRQVWPFVRTSGTVLCPVVGRRDPGWIVAVFLLFLLRVLHVLQVPGRGVLVLGVVGVCLKVLGASQRGVSALFAVVGKAPVEGVWMADLWLAASMALLFNCARGEHGARLQIRCWVSGVGGGPCGWRTSMSCGAVLGFVPRCERQLGGLRARPGPGCLWPIPNVPAF